MVAGVKMPGIGSGVFEFFSDYKELNFCSVVLVDLVLMLSSFYLRIRG